MKLGLLEKWLRRGSRESGTQPSTSSLGNPRTRADSGGENAAPYLDLAALMAIDSLELRIQRMLQGVVRGIHRSARRGASSEFTEYRPYTQGDDLRHMDWRRLARTDRPYVRQYEDETDWNTLTVLDLSASMAFGSLSYSKADYARTLAGTLASFLHSQGDAAGLLRFAADIEDLVPVRNSPRQMARWWSVLAASASGRRTVLGSAFERALTLLRRPGLVVVVSDFISPPSEWAGPLRMLRAAGHEVLCFEVLDPQELEFSFEGDTRFEGLEEDVVRDVNAAQARDAYLSRLKRHREEVALACERESVLFFEARTDRPLEVLLRSALEAVSARRVKSPGGSGGRRAG